MVWPSSPPRGNHDKIVTKPFKFYRLNDETTRLCIILYRCSISFFYKNCGFVVSSVKLEWFRHGFVVVSSRIRRVIVRTCTASGVCTCPIAIAIARTSATVYAHVLSKQYGPCITYSFSACMYNSYGTCMHHDSTRIKFTCTVGKVCACTIAIR